MDKYCVPNLPKVQHILEDLCDENIMKLHKRNDLPQDKQLRNAFQCYNNLEDLKSNIDKQKELNDDLKYLNDKLVESIIGMKAQIK